MKNAITLVTCALFITMGVAQTDLDLSTTAVSVDPSERTAALNSLYEQGRYLENNGSALEIEANRLAIKTEWQSIDPDIAALYKPVENGGALPETEENVGINGVSIPAVIREREPISQARAWDDDRLIRNFWVDGVDMEVTGSGDIYISTYINYINTGSTRDSIAIYRSLDGGASFDQWVRVAATASIEKLQLISFDGVGTEYLVAYLLTDSETFQAWRWDTSTAAFQAEVVATGVSDFGVDRNYPSGTSTQRAFATYQKMTSCTNVHSARSTAGSYGFGWVDEVTTSSTCGQQVEFAYGRDGATYTTYTGASSGNLYGNVNNNYNDPASWGTRETIVTGASRESVNPRIVAARKPLASDEVLVITSSRNAGTADRFNHTSYVRENQAAYAVLFDGIPLPNQSTLHMDTWVRKINATEEMRTSYIRDIVDNTSSDRCQSFTYDGTGMGTNDSVSDVANDVWDGFAAAVAETSDDLPCMAFAGTSGGGGFGFGLYFDSESVILGTQSNNLDGLTYYPNPVVDTFQISANNILESITIYNVLGKQVAAIKPNSKTVIVEASSFSSGMYIMEVVSGGQKANYKLIKQ